MEPTAVYVLECEEGAWYVGMSNDPDRRFQEHLICTEGFTSHYRPVRIAWRGWYPTRQRAEWMENLVTSEMRSVALKVGGGIRCDISPSGRGRYNAPWKYLVWGLPSELDVRNDLLQSRPRR